jgi:hypothetical protein
MVLTGGARHLRHVCRERTIMADPTDRTPKIRVYLDPESAGATAADPSLTPDEAAALAAAWSSPRFQQLVAVQLRIAARGTPALVLLDGPMPNGVLGLIRLGQPGPLSRCVILSREGFRDHAMDRVMMLQHRWETENPDDESPMTGTLFLDGRFTISSEKSGERSGVQRVTRMGHGRLGDIVTADLLARASAVQPQAIPGLGLGRVVELK